MLISSEGTGSNQLDPAKGNMGDAPVLSHCALFRNTWPKPTGVLEHCLEGETNSWFLHFSGLFLLTTSLRWRRMSVYISLYRTAIPLNYASEFQERFEVTIYSSCGSPYTFTLALVNTVFLSEMVYTSIYSSFFFSKMGSCSTTLWSFHQKSWNGSMKNVGIPRKIPSMPRKILRISVRQLAILKQ